MNLGLQAERWAVKNVTTYKKRELLELLLEVEKKQSSNAAESAVDNAENASADVKIKKTENRKKEEKKDDIPAAEHDNVAEQAGTAESDLKNGDKIENADEKRPQFQNSYVRNDYNEEHKNTYRNRREGGIQSSYGRTGNVRGQQRNNGRMNQRQGNNPYSNQNPGYSQNGYQSNSNHGGYQNNYNQNNGQSNGGYSQNGYNNGYQNGSYSQSGGYGQNGGYGQTITARVIIIRTAAIIKTTIIRTSQVHIQTTVIRMAVMEIRVTRIMLYRTRRILTSSLI